VGISAHFTATCAVRSTQCRSQMIESFHLFTRRDLIFRSIATYRLALCSSHGAI